MPVADGIPAKPARSCQLQWMREAGLWSAADDAAVILRYGPGALDDHWYCCRGAAVAGRDGRKPLVCPVIGHFHIVKFASSDLERAGVDL